MIKKIRIFFLALTLLTIGYDLHSQSLEFLQQASDPETDDLYREFINNNAPSEDAFIAVQRMAERFIEAKVWEKAISIFEEFKSKFPSMNDRFNKIIEILKAPEEGLKFENVGSGVNTADGEYHPTPTADGKYLYFTKTIGPKDEDIYVSEYLKGTKPNTGTWQSAQKVVGESINTSRPEAIMSISEDGQKIIVFGNYVGSYKGGDIFWFDKNYMGEWGIPKHFSYPINTNYFDSDGQLVAGDQAIIFSSDRPDCVGEVHPKGTKFHGDVEGNIDLWLCIKDSNGLWGDAAINLGKVINTPYAERFPFLHPDGKTLYFCSDGHPGLGRSDVFVSTRLREDSWTEWSEPINLGKEINTPAKEYFFKVTTDGDFAYLAKGDQPIVFDIYMQEVPSRFRPKSLATINGLVLDYGNNPLGAHIVIKDLSNGRIREADCDAEDGTFFFPLQLGRKYSYVVSLLNYETKSFEIDLSGLDTSKNFTRNDTIRLKTKITDPDLTGDIRFESGSHKIDPISFPELNRLSQIMIENPTYKMEIGAHTDSVGSDEFNLKLSDRRAKSIVTYIIGKGVVSSNLMAKGYGESRPYAPNSTAEGRALNRRVECKIITGEEDEDEDEEEDTPKKPDGGGGG